MYSIYIAGQASKSPLAAFKNFYYNEVNDNKKTLLIL